MSQLFLENFSHFIQWKKTANERKCYIWSCISDILTAQYHLDKPLWLLNTKWVTSPEQSESAHCWDWMINLWGWNTAMQLFQIILILYLVNCVTFGSSIWKCMKMHLRLLTSLNTHAYTNAYIDVLTYIWNIIYMKMTPKPYYMLSSGLIDKEPPLQNKQNCKRLLYLKVLWHNFCKEKTCTCTII